MGITIIDAAKLVDRGEADEYVNRFVGSVYGALCSTEPIAISLDDALVASMVLTRLADSTDGRKLLKMKKRKNTTYKAEKFSMFSPQRKVAAEFVSREINYPEALTKLESTFDDGHVPDRERTLKRLLDDLIALEEHHRDAFANLLALAGWDGTDETKETAVKRVLSVFAGKVPGITD